MRIMLKPAVACAGSLWVLAPATLWAHEGHAGSHGWLAGAAQPLLALDHFSAGLFVAAVVSIGLARVLRRGTAERPRP